MQKLNLLFTLLLFTTMSSLQAQNVGIGLNTPDASAKLHIEDANRGLMIPRVSLNDVTNGVTPVAAPLTGLLVFNTNAAVTGGNGQGFYYWDGTIWQRLQDGNSDAWLLEGNAGTNPTNNFVGTTDAQDLVFRTNNVENMRVNTNGNVGIGTASNIARMYTYIPGTDNTTNYGIRNYHDGVDNGTKYGIYSNVTADGTGGRYGIYNYTYQNSASTSFAYGMRNYLRSYGGTSTNYGLYNYHYTSGTGSHYGAYNYLYVNGTTASTRSYGSYNLVNVNSTNPSELHGEYTQVDYSNGIRYGEYKDMNTNATYFGTIYGDYNFVDGAGNDIIYGIYADITNTGTGAHYGIYSDVPGGTNDYAAFFNQGNVVMNEVGGVFNVRMETDTRPNAFYLDGTDNLLRVGNDLFGDFGNGNTVNGTVVDYVADFDNGVGATGTAVGIGSVEYFLDESSETTINNRFSPSQDNIYDLGSATLRWDDVYATNGTIVTSDEREKMNIEEMNYGLNEVMKLRPVTYKWKRNQIGSTTLGEEDKELKLGLIAQEVQQVLPEVVQTHDWRVLSEEQPDTYSRVPMERLGMTYHEIVPVLIKAIQEQQAEIDELKEQLKSMK